MKLFKSLLIAPAAFGLMAPIAVNADTAFSPTSKLGSSVNFTIGSNTDSVDGDELHSTYEMKFKSTTSFTGEDKLRLHNLLQQELHGVFHECFYRLQQLKFLTWMDS